MARKTEGVNLLVVEVLRGVGRPYGADIIRDVCFEIEENWMNQYQLLVDELGVGVVNQWIGRYTKEQTGLSSLNQVQVEPGHIIKSYTRLG